MREQHTSIVTQSHGLCNSVEADNDGIGGNLRKLVLARSR